MSKFSGKSDVFDWFRNRDFKHIKNSIIRLNGEPVKISKQYDLAPYYPYVIKVGYMNNDISNGFSVIDIAPPERLGDIYEKKWISELRTCGFTNKEIKEIVSKINVDKNK